MTMNNNYHDLTRTYLNLFKQLDIDNDLYYITIKPLLNLKSFKQLKFLNKMIIREICKIYNIKHYHNYIKYISVIEVSSSISKQKKTINNSGFHIHLFFNSKIDLFNCIDINLFLEVIKSVFFRNDILIELYESHEFYNLDQFILYHTKQFSILDKNHIITNIK